QVRQRIHDFTPKDISVQSSAATSSARPCAHFSVCYHRAGLLHAQTSRYICRTLDATGSLAALLALAAGNSVLRFRFDRPAGVSQFAPNLFTYGAAYVFWKCGQRLTGGSATAFKGAIIGVE